MTIKIYVIVAILLLLVVLILSVVFRKKGTNPNTDLKNPEGRTLNVLKSLQAGNYENALKDFEASYKAKMSPQEFGQGWSALIAAYGPIKGFSIDRVENLHGIENTQGVYFTCNFEKGTRSGVIVYNRSDKINIFAVCATPQEVQTIMEKVR